MGYESLHTGTRGERRTRLVERDVTIRANSSKEKLDTSVSLDLFLVLGALRSQIGSIAVENMNILRPTYERPH